jgi:hypothetical protein
MVYIAGGTQRPKLSSSSSLYSFSSPYTIKNHRNCTRSLANWGTYGKAVGIMFNFFLKNCFCNSKWQNTTPWIAGERQTSWYPCQSKSLSSFLMYAPSPSQKECQPRKLSCYVIPPSWNIRHPSNFRTYYMVKQMTHDPTRLSYLG